MLQVVVHRDDDGAARMRQAGHHRVVLAGVHAQVDAAEPGMLRGERFDHLPCIVGPAVVHEHRFETLDAVARRERGFEPAREFRQDACAAVDRNHDRQRDGRLNHSISR